MAGRLERLDRVLEQLEHTPGVTAATALEAIRLVAAVYGEALARIVGRLGTAAASLRDDELLAHLFSLHDIDVALRGSAAVVTAVAPPVRRAGRRPVAAGGTL